MNIYVIIFLLLINAFAYYLMWHDKQQAKANARRVPEKRLFLFAALGGALGSIIGMQLVRHKTKHWNFLVFMPLLLVLNLITFYPFAVFGFNNWITYMIHLLSA
jgi:uncharacterized membrane protein YsdA (DUF1294 family)